MTDSSKLNIQKIYMFLTDYNKGGNNWVQDADCDVSDGFITKKEFKSFMFQHESEWNGESKENSSMLINKFWNSVDVNLSGLCDGSKSIHEKNALGAQDLKRLEKNIKIYEALDKYIEDKNLLNSIPEGITDQQGWFKSVKESLTNKTENFINEGNENPDDLAAYLDKELPLIMNKTTANKFAQEYIKSDEIKKLLPDGFKDDKELQGIIDNFVKSLSGDLSTEDVKAGVEKIVKAYLATAELCDENTENLKGIYLTPGKLNDIQKAVLEQFLKEQITDEVLQEFEDYEDNKDKYAQARDAYIADVLKNTSYSDFGKVKSEFDIENFKTFAADFVAKPTVTVTKVDNTEEGGEIKNPGDSENNNGDLPNSFWNKLQTSYEVGVGASLPQFQLDNYVSIGDAFYDSSVVKFDDGDNNSHISVTKDGLVTITGGTSPGVYTETIKVFINNKLVGESAPITVIVSAPMELSKTDATYGGEKILDILNSGTGIWLLNDGWTSWGDAIANAKSKLKGCTDSLKKTLLGAGYKEELLDKAIKTTLNYYNALIDHLVEDRPDDNFVRTYNHEFKYYDADGNEHDASTETIHDSFYREKDEHGGEHSKLMKSKSGFSIEQSFHDNDTFKFYLNVSAFLRQFEKFYNGIF